MANLNLYNLYIMAAAEDKKFYYKSNISDKIHEIIWNKNLDSPLINNFMSLPNFKNSPDTPMIIRNIGQQNHPDHLDFIEKYCHIKAPAYPQQNSSCLSDAETQLIEAYISPRLKVTPSDISREVEFVMEHMPSLNKEFMIIISKQFLIMKDEIRIFNELLPTISYFGIEKMKKLIYNYINNKIITVNPIIINLHGSIEEE